MKKEILEIIDKLKNVGFARLILKAEDGVVIVDEDEVRIYKEDLNGMKMLLEDIFFLIEDKYGCDNIYVLKGSGRKLECDDVVAKIVRLIREYQTNYFEDQTEDELLSDIKELIESK